MFANHPIQIVARDKQPQIESVRKTKSNGYLEMEYAEGRKCTNVHSEYNSQDKINRWFFSKQIFNILTLSGKKFK